MTDFPRLEVNRAMRRRARFFGVDKSVGIVLMSILAIGFLLSSFIPINLAITVTLVLMIAGILIFKDGTGIFLARLRQPPHYTRAGYQYQRLYPGQGKRRIIL
jgi:hypothetical protein